MSKETKQEIKGRDCHIVMQGKGGVGKTFVAWLISQNFLDRKKPLSIIDMDPMNQSLTGFKGLDVHPYDVMEEGNPSEIDHEKMDGLVYKILEAEGDVLIDTGLSSFIALNQYMIEQDVSSVLHESGGVTTNLHCVIRDDGGMIDALNGLKSICEGHTDPNTKVFVWLNELDKGVRSKEGKEFEDFKVYKDNKDKISGVVRLNKQKKAYQEDLVKVIQSRKTMDEAIKDIAFREMSKSRLHQMKKYYNSAIQVHF